MKIVIPGATLNRVMRMIDKCVDKRMPTYSNVDIVWDAECLKFLATNGQQYCEIRVPMMGGNGESFAMDAAMLKRIADNAGNKDVVITVDGKACSIRGNGVVRTSVMDTQVHEPDGVEGVVVSFDGGKLKEAYRHVSDAVATDETKQVLTGVLMTVSPEGDVATMTALDGFQLARYSTGCEAGGETKMLIPKVMLDRVCDWLTDGVGVSIRSDGKRIAVDGGNMLMVGALLNGEYPNVDVILPKEVRTQVEVDVAELQNAVRGCDTIGNANKMVKIDIREDLMIVKNNNSEGEYESEVECITHGSPLKIAFNKGYFVNMLNALDEEKATLQFVSPVAPMTVKTENGEMTGMRLVLPVRVFE